MSQTQKVFTALFFSMLFWGFSFIWSAEALTIYNPFTVLLFRLSLSVIIMYFFNFYLKRLKLIKMSDLPIFITLAFFQPFLYFIGENYGLLYSSPTTTSVVISTIPLFSPIAAFFFLKEKISLLNIAGIIISVLGVFMVILKPGQAFSASGIGMALLGLAVFSAVIYSVILAKLSGRYNVYTILFTQNILGIIFFIPVFLYFDLNKFLNTGLVLKGIYPIVLLAFFGSTLAYLFFIYGVKHLGVTKTNIFANIIPAFTAFFSFLIIGEKLEKINIFGIFIVVFGVMITQIKFKKKIITKAV